MSQKVADDASERRQWFGVFLPNPALDTHQREARQWAADVGAILCVAVIVLIALMNLLARRWPWMPLDNFPNFYVIFFALFPIVWSIYLWLGRRERILSYFFVFSLLGSNVGVWLNGANVAGTLLVIIVTARLILPRHHAWRIMLAFLASFLVYYFGRHEIDVTQAPLVYRVIVSSIVVFCVLDTIIAHAASGRTLSHLAGMRQLWLVTGLTTVGIWVLGSLTTFAMHPLIVVTFIAVSLSWWIAERFMPPTHAMLLFAMIGLVMQSVQAVIGGMLALPYVALTVMALFLALPLSLFIVSSAFLIVLNTSMYVLHDDLVLNALYSRFVLGAFFCVPMVMVVHDFYLPGQGQGVAQLFRSADDRRRFLQRCAFGLLSVVVLLLPVFIAYPSDATAVVFMTTSHGWFWWWMIIMTLGLISALLTMSEQRRRQLAELLQQAKEDDAMKTAFVVNMSHDIRSPMNGLLGLQQVLALDSSLSNDVRRRLDSIKKSSEQLLHLVDDISDIGRIERGELIIHLVPFDLSALVAGQLEAKRRVAAKAGVILAEDLQIPDACMALGDSFRLAQLIDNLVGNAIKFSPHGRVDIRVQYQAEQLLVVVADTGIGMDQDTLSRVFTRFEQGDVGYTKRFQGLGLGLAIASEITQRMGGTLQAESQLGAGSVFTLRLPLPHMVGNDSPMAEQQHASTDELKAKTLLIVDDDPLSLVALESLLRDTAGALYLAHDGHAALDYLKQYPIDIVVTDIAMPVMDGQQLLLAMRQQHYCQPVVAITGHATANELAHFQTLGFAHVMSKPLQLPSLLAVLHDVMQGPQDA
ncbi:MAG TPA: ATP-binding protein [Pseudomonadales bacterium]|nr:ATP-binding protein [Pseudomonadales bacterium]